MSLNHTLLIFVVSKPHYIVQVIIATNINIKLILDIHTVIYCAQYRYIVIYQYCANLCTSLGDSCHTCTYHATLQLRV